MSFLFLGLDACDIRMATKFELLDGVSYLEQDLPALLRAEGFRPMLGWWTTYVWPAILSGQVVHHHTQMDHEVVPDLEKFDRLAWKGFGSSKLIGLPFAIPEFNKNTKFFNPGTINRHYGPEELRLLAMEINHGLENYDAVFAVTRFLDSCGHGEIGMTQAYHDWMTEEGYEEERTKQMTDRVVKYLENIYTRVKNQLLDRIKWDLVDQHVVVSDHGFQNVGGKSVQSHSKFATLKTNLGEWTKMSEFIEGWLDKVEYKAEKELVDDKEEVKKHLEGLGYI